VTGFAEAPHHSDATAAYMSGYFATRAVKGCPGRVEEVARPGQETVTA